MIIKTVTEADELEEIKLLQQLNLRSGISAAEAAAEGFVTAEYSIDLLTEMHNITPSIVAKDGNRIAGYALATINEESLTHDLLNQLFDAVDGITYEGVKLKGKYILVGQLCVAKEYRGIGVVQQLYNKFRETYSGSYQYCVTDVAESNPRSLKAHIKSGFKVIDTLKYGGIGWNIVLWDWRN